MATIDHGSPGGNTPDSAVAASVPAAAPVRRSAALYATSPRPRLPLLTMNAVSTTQVQCAPKRVRPTANAAASAAAICSAILVLGAIRRPPRAGAAAGGAAGGAAGWADGGTAAAGRIPLCSAASRAPVAQPRAMTATR